MRTGPAQQPDSKISINQKYQIFNAYLDLHPEIAKKYDHFKRLWRRSHSHDLPTTADEAKEYKAMMVQYVGKMDIDAEKVTDQWNAHWDATHKKKAAKLSAAAALAAKEREDAGLKAKLDAVHAEWARKHGAEVPSTAAQRAEYKAMLVKAGVVSQKRAPTTLLAASKAHTPEELEKAKARALMDLEKHNGDVKARIEKVHEEWMRHHKAPPRSAAEEKEYDALMDKYVGHPDVSNQYVADGKPALAAAAAKPADEDKMLDLDAALLS